MSYDVRVWGRKAADLSSCLPGERGWTADAGGWVLPGRSWQIVVGAPTAVEHEDVPAEVAELLPGISTLVEVQLEPISAPKSARSQLLSTARAIADALAGVVEDPHEGSATPHPGAKRYSAPSPEERITVLELSWWYMQSPLRSQRGAADFVAALQRHVTEAVPRRYGTCEPPPFQTAETGVGAFVEFLHQHLDGRVVCYMSRPVVGLNIADCDAVRDPRAGFRSNYVSIEFEASALDQPGWEQAIRNLWRAVSRLLRPFYGDVRLLANHLAHGGRIRSDRRTDFHPVYSWWWRGIPAEPGLAVVVGPPYTDLWSPAGAESVDDLVFAETPSWAARRPLDLQVPRDLAQRWKPEWIETSFGFTQNWCREMPETWPLPQS
jgi:hypothetical protein